MAAVLLYVCSTFVVWMCCLTTRSLADNLNCPSSCSCLLSHVTCTDTGLVNIPKDIPSWITHLELQHNSITEILPDDFKGLDKIESLDISENQIRHVNGSVFRDLTVLATLNLAGNELQEMPLFPHKSGIKELYLSKNSIRVISTVALERMPNLTTLDLSFNYILSIPNGTFPRGCMLSTLNLNNNHIAVLEKGGLSNLAELQTLRVNKNKLRELPALGFQDLVKLRLLELMKNEITHIKGVTFNGMKRLHTLKLKKNDIAELDTAAFYELKSLVNLQLSHNKITSIKKEWMYGLTMLRVLSLARNKISEINPDALTCRNLEKLDLSHNQLRAILRETLSPLRQLKQLVLSHNRISTIEAQAFSEQRRLHTLELNHNEISWSMEDAASVFKGLNRLNRLGLRANGISTIPVHAFSGLQNLRELSLVDNEITSIQENAFETLRQLDILKFNSSKFTCDCHLSWLPGWLQINHFSSTATGTCFYPAVLKGMSLDDVNMDTDKDCKSEYLKPVISESPRSVVTNKGGNLTLRCVARVSGNSQPIIRWKKDKVWLPESMFTVTAARKGDVTHYTSTLEEQNVQDSTKGTFRCVVSNEFGHAFSQKALISVIVYPAFIQTPENVTVKAGKNAELKCAATGEPTPTISWQKDGGDSFPAARERRMQVYPDDSHFYILTVQAADQGVYSCKAENRAGSVVSNATVTVLETPDFVEPMQRKKSTRKGETSVLQCMASGSPQPKLSWLKDGKNLLMTPRHFFTVDNQILVIVDTQWSDAGLYSCRISNSLGTVKGATQLKVLSASGEAMEASSSSFGLDDKSTTTGIIIIAVVCCVVGTSLVWVIIIYQTRKRHEMYSAAPSDETTLPGEVPSSGYMSSDREGSYSQGLLTTGYHYQDYQMKESGYESSSGQFRVQPVIYPNGVDEDEPVQRMTAGDRLLRQTTNANSAGSLQYVGSVDGDTLGSRHSTSSGQQSGTSDQPSSYSCRTAHSSSPTGHMHPQQQLHVKTGDSSHFHEHQQLHSRPSVENSPNPDYFVSPNEEERGSPHYSERSGRRGPSSSYRSLVPTASPERRPLLQTFHPKKHSASSSERFHANTLDGVCIRKEKDDGRELGLPQRRAVSRDAVTITERDSDEEGSWGNQYGFRSRTHSDSCDKRKGGYNQYYPVSLGPDDSQSTCINCGCETRVGKHKNDCIPHEIQTETGSVNCDDPGCCHCTYKNVSNCSHSTVHTEGRPYPSSSVSPPLSSPSSTSPSRHSHHNHHQQQPQQQQQQQQQTRGAAIHSGRPRHTRGCVNNKSNSNSSKDSHRKPQNDFEHDGNTHGNMSGGSSCVPPCCCEVMRDAKYCTSCPPSHARCNVEEVLHPHCCHCSKRSRSYQIQQQQNSGRKGALQIHNHGVGRGSASPSTFGHDPGYSDLEGHSCESQSPSKHHPHCTNHSSKPHHPPSGSRNRPSAPPPPYSTVSRTPPPYIPPPERPTAPPLAEAAPQASTAAPHSTIPTSPSSHSTSNNSKKSNSCNGKNDVMNSGTLDL